MRYRRRGVFVFGAFGEPVTARIRSYVLSCVLPVCLTFASGAAALDDLVFQIPQADKDLRGAIRASSLLVQTQQSEDAADPQELLAAARADYARILGVLYANGYYGGVITIGVDGREAATIPPLGAPDTIREIRVQVMPGPQYLFHKLRVAPLAPRTELPEEFARGEPGGTGAIRDAADEAILSWRKAGHAKAEISDQKIVARHSERRIDADLAVAPGPKVTFGTLNISGKTNVRETRIRKIAGLNKGDVYSPDELDRVATRLRRTGTFRSVTLTEGETLAPDNSLPLDIGVVDQTPRRFGAGIELSTVEGLTLSGFWLHRNLLRGAERLRIDGEIAGIGGATGGTDYSLSARYERPATPLADTDLFVLGEYAVLDEPDFKSNTGTFTVGFSRRFNDKLTGELGLGYLYSDETDDLGQNIYHLAILPLGLTWDRRDDILDPTDGFFLDADLIPFGGLKGSESGTRFVLDARGYQSFGAEDRTTIAARIQLGALAGPQLEDSPAIYRFYSGGGGTVRGQDYQSLGIDLGGSDRVGGRSYLGVSGELRQGITEKISAVAFYDWGYIGENALPDDSGGSHSGAGFGIRYNTGIGPIRLDLAAPISGDEDASSFYIYVGIGQAF